MVFLPKQKIHSPNPNNIFNIRNINITNSYNFDIALPARKRQSGIFLNNNKNICIKPGATDKLMVNTKLTFSNDGYSFFTIDSCFPLKNGRRRVVFQILKKDVTYVIRDNFTYK